MRSILWGKLGRLLCRITFVCCAIGFCLCLAGIVTLALGLEPLTLGRVRINSFVRMDSPLSMTVMYAVIASAMILCRSEAVLARLAQHDFQRALSDVTPFTLDGTQALKQLGILTICRPLTAQIAAEIL